jgi:coproporphyrinogen III oxidase-like Fe-S oxidoreductase
LIDWSQSAPSAAFKVRISAMNAMPPEIDALAVRGLVHRSGGPITIAEDARPLVRTICAVFDAYLSDQETRYSRAV